jgi:hypothetical protein
VLRGVLPKILKNISYRVSRLPRRLQIVPVIAIREHRPLPPKDAVQPARDPNVEPVHPAAERSLVARLDDQVQVVAQHREVDDPELLAPDSRRTDRVTDQLERPIRA